MTVVVILGAGRAGRVLQERAAEAGVECRMVALDGSPSPSLSLSPDDLAGVDLVVDSGELSPDGFGGPETYRLLADADALVPLSVPIVTAGAALALGAASRQMARPARLVGAALFDAVHPVFEVVVSPDDGGAVARVLQALRDLGVETVEVADRPGLLLRRLLVPYLNDTAQFWDDGMAQAADIDTAMRLGLGYRLGPFDLLARIGIDQHVHTAEQLCRQTGDARFFPPDGLSRARDLGIDAR